MSEKPRFPAANAKAVATELLCWLEPACERLVVAGSLRRDQPTVGDVEILYNPKIEKRSDPADMFASIDVNLVDEVIWVMEQENVLQRRKDRIGRETFGPLNKLMRHLTSGFSVDLFCEPSLDDWWRSLVFRTGPKELNVRLITTAARRGVRVHAYGTGLTTMITGAPKTIPCESEERFFEICGVRYLEPKDRR